jgi:hypothetical protein
MHALVLIVWIFSLAAFAFAAFWPPPQRNITAIGLLLFDLWLGLQFLIEVKDPITF